MRPKEVIEFLIKEETSVAETKTYSKLPGIYALFYTGKNFPVLGNKVKKHQIIYIGKTESSQEKRDSKTHFSSGKTGSSTVRKSIGSLLYQHENLNPIPRNGSDYARGKFSHFKFDNEGENTITKWMKENLALSFYEYPRSKSEINRLETEIIDIIVPILNIAKNPKNDFKATLKKLRKACAIDAAKEFNVKEIHTKPRFLSPKNSITNGNLSGKYSTIWQNHIITIKQILMDSDESSIPMDSADFDNAGNRKSYSFNLEFKDGMVSNNINGSAVARDLARVLENDAEIKKALRSAHHKFSMGKDFVLNIKR